MRTLVLVVALVAFASETFAQGDASYFDRLCRGMAIPVKDRAKLVARLTTELKSKNVDVRSSAADSLACLGEAAIPAIPDMILLFREPNGEARANMIEAVAHLGKAAVPALRQGLSSKDVDMRRGACGALAAIGAPARPALSSLAILLDEPGYDVSLAAEQAMKRILCEKCPEKK